MYTLGVKLIYPREDGNNREGIPNTLLKISVCSTLKYFSKSPVNLDAFN